MNSYNIIRKSIIEKCGQVDGFSLERSNDFSHGDYSTNIAFSFSKNENLSPVECANRLAPYFAENLVDIVKKVEVAGPGFINFFLKDEIVRKDNSQKSFDVETKYTHKNILVEHSSPNLFKPFHIGHLMNNIVGEFVVRAIKECGAKVTTVSFPSDISLGIAKAIYIIEEDKHNNNDVISATNDEAKIIAYLGECYVRGIKLSQDYPELEDKIKAVSQDLFNQIDSGDLVDGDAYEVYTKVRTVNKVYFENVLKGLGTHIDAFIFESEAGKIGKSIVKNNPDVFTEGEKGAIIYVPKEERKDLNVSVFINSEGHPTYEAKDIGLLEKKFTDYGDIDYSFFVTDNEQSHHFKIVLDAAERIGGAWIDRVAKSKHIPHGRMLFKGGKMSSRLGGVPLALDVITVIEEEVRERSGEKIIELTNEEKKKLERDIALSSLRIAVLRSKPGINTNFDPETSLSFEGDSGPYLMYTHARCCSLLNKKNDVVPTFHEREITNLEKVLFHFEREYIFSCEELAPQKLVAYLFSVAQAFNAYYAAHQILVENDDEGNAHRLMIVKRTQEVLKRGLYVLGINAPERM